MRLCARSTAANGNRWQVADQRVVAGTGSSKLVAAVSGSSAAVAEVYVLNVLWLPGPRGAQGRGRRWSVVVTFGCGRRTFLKLLGIGPGILIWLGVVAATGILSASQGGNVTRPRVVRVTDDSG
jgi:hypothetical protein